MTETYTLYNDPIYKRVVKAKTTMMFTRPFYGALVRDLEIVDASKWCRSTATDGRRFFYNREYIKNSTDANIVFMLAHEILHCILQHVGRRGNRDKQLYDAAIDFIVNYTLVNEQTGKMPDNGAFDLRFNDENTVEEVFMFLEQNRTTMEIPISLDEHIELSPDDGSGNTKVSVSGGADGPPILTRQDVAEIQMQMESAMMQATIIAKAAGHGIPGCVSRILDRLTKPILNWRALIDKFYRSQVRMDRSYSRMSRRSLVYRHTTESKFILPHRGYLDTIDLDVALDVSGSMSEDMLRDVLGEVVGCAKTFPAFKLRVWSFDTGIHNPMEYTQETVNEVKKYPILKDRGGTDFMLNWDYMKREKIKPKKLVVLTDGMPYGSWGDPNYCDTLWIIFGDPKRQHVAPFGKTTWYEPKHKKAA